MLTFLSRYFYQGVGIQGGASLFELALRDAELKNAILYRFRASCLPGVRWSPAPGPQGLKAAPLLLRTQPLLQQSADGCWRPGRLRHPSDKRTYGYISEHSFGQTSVRRIMEDLVTTMWPLLSESTSILMRAGMRKRRSSRSAERSSAPGTSRNPASFSRTVTRPSSLPPSSSSDFRR